MLLNHNPTKILISGKSSSGKSIFWTRYILNSYKVRYPFVFIFDHEGEFSYRNGFQPCYTVEDIEAAYPGGMICFDPVEMFSGDLESAFVWFCDFVFELRVWTVREGNQGDNTPIALFACDELQMLTDVYSLPLEFKRLLQTGRRYGLDTLFISQQLNEMNNRLRNQLTECVTFQHIDTCVLDVMEAWGFDPGAVASLERPGEYLICNYDQETITSGHLFRQGYKSTVTSLRNRALQPLQSEAPEIPEPPEPMDPPENT